MGPPGVLILDLRVRFYDCIGSQRWRIYRLIAAEVSSGMDVAVESRMAQGKKRCMIQAGDPGQDEFSQKEVLARYKGLNGKTTLKSRGQVA